MFSGENKDVYGELCELLVAGGYFRARIAGLSQFDKVAGGLAWAIQSSREAIDVDFVEDANIGHKIKIGENIEEALRNMRCPVPLAAHQIQGLDYPSIYPVVQWLLKKVLATRQEFARSLKEYANLCFARSIGQLPDELTQEPSQKIIPSRQLKRNAQRNFANHEDHVLSVLLEYGQKSQLLAEATTEEVDAEGGETKKSRDEAAEEAELDKLLQDMASYKVSAKLAGKDVTAAMRRDQAAIDKFSEVFKAKEEILRAEQEKEDEAKNSLSRLQAKTEKLKSQIESQMSQIATVQASYQSVCEELESANKAMEKADRRNKRITAEIEKLGGSLDAKRQKALQELEILVKQNEELEQQKAEILEKFRKKLQLWKEKIESAKTENRPVEENEHYKQVEAQHAAEQAKVNKVLAMVAKKNREVANIQRQIDDIPTRSELVQYERRFTELYEQVRWKFEETKQYYNRYNTLTETVSYLKKEMDLLDHIHEQFDQVMNSKARDSFPTSLEKTVDSVKKSKEKVLTKLENERKTHQALSDACNALLSKQRAYYLGVKEFQEECDRNEQLKQKIEKARNKQ